MSLSDSTVSECKIPTATNINLDLFIEIVEFCLNNSYFRFRDKFYLQTFGTAMGSPLSPILADIVMENLISTVIRSLPFKIPVLRKYVDDLVLALPKNQVQQTLHIFNSYNENIQFTIELESDSKLPFLDTLLIRNKDQTISTQWYSKPIASGRLINYHSFHPTSIKINVATNLIKRIVQLTTNKSADQQKHIIYQHLKQNDYPSALINRLINKHHTKQLKTSTQQHHQTIDHSKNISQNHPLLETTHSIYTSASVVYAATEDSNDNNDPPPTSNITAPETAYKSLPYIPLLSKCITATLQADYPAVKLAHRPIKTTRGILRQVKDSVEPLQQSNVIYSIPCEGCSKSYIGMTKNQLRTRLSGHRSNINKYSSLTNNPPEHADQEIASLGEKTALIHHMIKHGHSFAINQTKIIDRAFRSSALPLLEMCHITNTANTVNHRTDVQGPNTTYAGILHSVKTSQGSSRQKPNIKKASSYTNTIVPKASSVDVLGQDSGV
ncbi:uncharacterized protein LOC131680624 [Topomyia yanbarensis]|uniref:uncharacterized protein LOC131680624 n=1 Tax=Topomyia yanbarensis TaxID=2498891 RepID=UPI00273C354F|nr:uncharacterized protein LOC131680624 [Topomyia yanbarensis]